MAVRSRIDELEEWCFWHRPQSNQGTVLPNYLQHVCATSASVPSPEYSDSLDSTFTYSKRSTSVNDYNFNAKDLSSEACSREDSPCRIFAASFKNISASQSSATNFPNELVSRLKDSLGVRPPEYKKNDRRANEVRRVASSDSIPVSPTGPGLFNRSYRVFSQDCVRRAKSPDVRNPAPQLRYIQSAKGTWTYNF